jgi:simple sugar transport system ATP-binding protein
MDDIFSVCDRVMALFQGTNFAESTLKNTSRDEVIGWIMGKKGLIWIRVKIVHL